MYSHNDMINDIYSKIRTIVLNHINKQYGADPSYAVDICISLKLRNVI